MPMLIEHIDAIARKKQRDVLYVRFDATVDANTAENGDEALLARNRPDWEHLPVRRQIIDWLEGAGLAWGPCGGIAGTNGWSSYRGHIYIDGAYDTALPDYARLAAFLENPDGSTRLANAQFCYLPLARAMENVHHDEPGFWEKWAEDF